MKLHILLLKTDLKGIVQKEPRKEQTGVLEINFGLSGTSKEEVDKPLHALEQTATEQQICRSRASETSE